MSLPPILAALRRHKSGAVLIALQIALTLAIVCNALFIIGQRIGRMNRPTGLEESRLFVVSQRYVGAFNADTQAGADRLDAMQRADMAALRRLPSVESAAQINTMPLLNASWNAGVSTKLHASRNNRFRCSFYFSDQHMLKTLGLQLAAGRNFTSAEVRHIGFRNLKVEQSPVILITQDMARKLFPSGSALGKVVYLDGGTSPSTIIGIVKRLQTPSIDAWAASFTYSSVLVPVRFNNSFSRYAVRARPGQMALAIKAARSALFKLNPMRVIDDNGIRRFADIRAQAYKSDRSMAMLMGSVCMILLALTAAGIVGLTSFWVSQRTKQIGIRRALGARAIDIMRYFQIENLMIAAGGVLLGLLMAYGLNAWLMQRFELQRMPISYPLTGILVVLLIGQAAVFAPARRASKVSPVTATRSV